jgi:hypothetical protein
MHERERERVCVYVRVGMEEFLLMYAASACLASKAPAQPNKRTLTQVFLPGLCLFEQGGRLQY